MRSELCGFGAALLLASTAVACSPKAATCTQQVGSGRYVDLVHDPVVPDKTLDVDRGKGTVTLSYVKDGKHVQEHWHITH